MDPEMIALTQQVLLAANTLANNESTSRLAWMRKLLDTRRDIEHECGHPEDITRDDYMLMFDRFSIARRVVEAMPKECWQKPPRVYENDDPDDKTDFEEALAAVNDRLRHGSKFRGEKGQPVFNYLKRLDIMSGIGQFGVLLLGINDGLSLEQPANGQDTNDSVSSFVSQYFGEGAQPPAKPSSQKRAKPPKRELMYARVFPEPLVQIVQYEADIRNQRFGQPVMYLVTLNDPRETHGGIGLPTATVRVHWTRVVHAAECDSTSSVVYGQARMKPVFDHLLDLRKLYGGSAEMYWQGAFPGISFSTHPQLGGDVAVDVPALKDAYELYRNGLQRLFILMGMTANTLSPTVVDPSQQIAVHLEAIAVALAMPLRILKGSERGELASSQDDSNWNDRVMERCENYVTPSLIVPFVDRLIALGVLPEPEQYYVEWPDITSRSAQEKAATNATRIQTVASYVTSGAEALITPTEFLMRFMEFTREEAEQILESASDQNQGEADPDAGGSPLLSMVGGVGAILQMFTSFQQGAMSEETLKQLLMLFYKVDEDKADAIIAGGLPDPPPGLPAVPSMRGGGAGAVPPPKAPTGGNGFAQK